MNTQRMPGIGAVVRAQLALLVYNKYVVGLAALLSLYVLVVYGVVGPLEDLAPWQGPGLMMGYIMMLGFGGIAGAIVWFNEAPPNRRYHWAMPVRREVHDIVRIGAGAAWLLAAIAMYCVFAWFLEDPMARDHWLRGQWIVWVGMFLVPLLAYLLITIPCIMLGRPLLVILGVLTTAIFISLEPVRQAAPLLGDIGYALINKDHPPSLGAALGGGLLSAPWANPANQKRVYDAVSEQYWTESEAPRAVRMTVQRSMQHAGAFPPPPMTTREWLGSLALWYVIALLGIAVAIRRRPDV